MSRPPGPPRARGFTLLELLVVVVIVGILATMFTLSVGVAGRDRELEREADRFRALVDLAAEDAVIQGRELGLRFHRSGYEFSWLNPDEGLWQSLGTDDLLRPRELPDGLELGLEIEGRTVRLPDAPREAASDAAASGAAASEPQVFIFSSGDVNPAFRVVLRRTFANEGLAIAVELDGQIDVTREPG